MMRRKNDELAQAYKDKSRKLLQTQELYDRVKRKVEMGQIERAASDAVDSTLNVPPQGHVYRPRQGIGTDAEIAMPISHDNRVDLCGFGRPVPAVASQAAPTGSSWPGAAAAMQRTFLWRTAGTRTNCRQ